jgi:RimJ/RimL family protein N-acetyltransferase
MNPLLLDLPETLKSERLSIRRYIPGDGAWLHKVLLDNVDHLALAIRGGKEGFGFDVTTPEGAESFVRQLHADGAARRRWVCGTWEKATGDYVGDLWIEFKDWDASMHEIGYFVVEKKLGQGYATEATMAGLEFLFEVLDTRKVVLSCDESNTPSYRVAERCGFVREGCLRAHSRLSDGTWDGQLHYGMLREEYEQFKKTRK